MQNSYIRHFTLSPLFPFILSSFLENLKPQVVKLKQEKHNHFFPFFFFYILPVTLITLLAGPHVKNYYKRRSGPPSVAYYWIMRFTGLATKLPFPKSPVRDAQLETIMRKNKCVDACDFYINVVLLQSFSLVKHSVTAYLRTETALVDRRRCYRHCD